MEYTQNYAKEIAFNRYIYLIEDMLPRMNGRGKEEPIFYSIADAARKIATSLTYMDTGHSVSLPDPRTLNFFKTQTGHIGAEGEVGMTADFPLQQLLSHTEAGMADQSHVDLAKKMAPHILVEGSIDPKEIGKIQKGMIQRIVDEQSAIITNHYKKLGDPIRDYSFDMILENVRDPQAFIRRDLYLSGDDIGDLSKRMIADDFYENVSPAKIEEILYKYQFNRDDTRTHLMSLHPIEEEAAQAMGFELKNNSSQEAERFRNWIVEQDEISLNELAPLRQDQAQLRETRELLWQARNKKQSITSIIQERKAGTPLLNFMSEKLQRYGHQEDSVALSWIAEHLQSKAMNAPVFIPPLDNLKIGQVLDEIQYTSQAMRDPNDITYGKYAGHRQFRKLRQEMISKLREERSRLNSELMDPSNPNNEDTGRRYRQDPPAQKGKTQYAGMRATGEIIPEINYKTGTPWLDHEGKPIPRVLRDSDGKIMFEQKKMFIENPDKKDPVKYITIHDRTAPIYEREDAFMKDSKGNIMFEERLIPPQRLLTLSDGTLVTDLIDSKGNILDNRAYEIFEVGEDGKVPYEEFKNIRQGNSISRSPMHKPVQGPAQLIKKPIVEMIGDTMSAEIIPENQTTNKLVAMIPRERRLELFSRLLDKPEEDSIYNETHRLLTIMDMNDFAENQWKEYHEELEERWGDLYNQEDFLSDSPRTKMRDGIAQQIYGPNKEGGKEVANQIANEIREKMKQAGYDPKKMEEGTFKTIAENWGYDAEKVHLKEKELDKQIVTQYTAREYNPKNDALWREMVHNQTRVYIPGSLARYNPESFEDGWVNLVAEHVNIDQITMHVKREKPLDELLAEVSERNYNDQRALTQQHYETAKDIINKSFVELRFQSQHVNEKIREENEVLYEKLKEAEEYTKAKAKELGRSVEDVHHITVTPATLLEQYNLFMPRTEDGTVREGSFAKYDLRLPKFLQDAVTAHMGWVKGEDTAADLMSSAYTALAETIHDLGTEHATLDLRDAGFEERMRRFNRTDAYIENRMAKISKMSLDERLNEYLRESVVGRMHEAWFAMTKDAQTREEALASVLHETKDAIIQAGKTTVPTMKNNTPGSTSPVGKTPLFKGQGEEIQYYLRKASSTIRAFPWYAQLLEMDSREIDEILSKNVGRKNLSLEGYFQNLRKIVERREKDPSDPEYLGKAAAELFTTRELTPEMVERRAIDQPRFESELDELVGGDPKMEPELVDTIAPADVERHIKEKGIRSDKQILTQIYPQEADEALQGWKPIDKKDVGQALTFQKAQGQDRIESTVTIDGVSRQGFIYQGEKDYFVDVPDLNRTFLITQNDQDAVRHHRGDQLDPKIARGQDVVEDISTHGKIKRAFPYSFDDTQTKGRGFKTHADPSQTLDLIHEFTGGGQVWKYLDLETTGVSNSAIPKEVLQPLELYVRDIQWDTEAGALARDEAGELAVIGKDNSRYVMDEHYLIKPNQATLDYLVNLTQAPRENFTFQIGNETHAIHDYIRAEKEAKETGTINPLAERIRYRKDANDIRTVIAQKESDLWFMQNLAKFSGNMDMYKYYAGEVLPKTENYDKYFRQLKKDAVRGAQNLRAKEGRKITFLPEVERLDGEDLLRYWNDIVGNNTLVGQNIAEADIGSILRLGDQVKQNAQVEFNQIQTKVASQLASLRNAYLDTIADRLGFSQQYAWVDGTKDVPKGIYQTVTHVREEDFNQVIEIGDGKRIPAAMRIKGDPDHAYVHYPMPEGQLGGDPNIRSLHELQITGLDMSGSPLDQMVDPKHQFYKKVPIQTKTLLQANTDTVRDLRPLKQEFIDKLTPEELEAHIQEGRIVSLAGPKKLTEPKIRPKENPVPSLYERPKDPNRLPDDVELDRRVHRKRVSQKDRASIVSMTKELKQLKNKGKKQKTPEDLDRMRTLRQDINNLYAIYKTKDPLTHDEAANLRSRRQQLAIAEWDDYTTRLRTDMAEMFNRWGEQAGANGIEFRLTGTTIKASHLDDLSEGGYVDQYHMINQLLGRVQSGETLPNQDIQTLQSIGRLTSTDLPVDAKEYVAAQNQVQQMNKVVDNLRRPTIAEQMFMSKMLFPEARRHNAESQYERLGIAFQGEAHLAKTDVVTGSMGVEKMIHMLMNDEAYQNYDFANLQVGDIVEHHRQVQKHIPLGVYQVAGIDDQTHAITFQEVMLPDGVEAKTYTMTAPSGNELNRRFQNHFDFLGPSLDDDRTSNRIDERERDAARQQIASSTEKAYNFDLHNLQRQEMMQGNSPSGNLQNAPLQKMEPVYREYVNETAKWEADQAKLQPSLRQAFDKEDFAKRKQMTTEEFNTMLKSRHLFETNEGRDLLAPMTSRNQRDAFRLSHGFYTSKEGQARKEFLDDVRALESTKRVDGNTATDLIRKMNEEIKAKGHEKGYTRAVQDKVHIGTLGKEFRHFEGDNVNLDISNPQRLRNSIWAQAEKMIDLGKDAILERGGEVTDDAAKKYVLNALLMPFLANHGAIDKYDFNNEKQIPTVASAMKQIMTREVVAPDVEPVPGKQLQMMEEFDHLAFDRIENDPEFLDFMKAKHQEILQPYLSDLSPLEKAKFGETKRIIQEMQDRGTYHPKMNIGYDAHRLLQEAHAEISTMRLPHGGDHHPILKQIGNPLEMKALADQMDTLTEQGHRTKQLIYNQLFEMATAGRTGSVEGLLLHDYSPTKLQAAEALNWILPATPDRLQEIEAQRAPILEREQQLRSQVETLHLPQRSKNEAGEYSRELNPLEKQLQKTQGQLNRIENDLADARRTGYVMNPNVADWYWGAGHTVGHVTRDADTKIGRMATSDLDYIVSGKSNLYNKNNGYGFLKNRLQYWKEELNLQGRSENAPLRPLSLSYVPVTESNMEEVGLSDPAKEWLRNTTADRKAKGQTTRMTKRTNMADTIKTPRDPGAIEKWIDRQKTEAVSLADNFATALKDSGMASGAKWIAGLGVAAYAFHQLTSSGDPLKMERRPQGHGGESIGGFVENENRETPSYRAPDTSGRAIVSAGGNGYTVKAKATNNNGIQFEDVREQLQKNLGDVNINLQDDQTSMDRKWLEDQMSTYINRGHL